MNDLVLDMKQVSLAFDSHKVLDKVDFQLEKGDFAYLVGRTGVGKSSLLKLIYADQRPEEGGIVLGGQKVNPISIKNIPYLRRKLGIVFQDYQLLSDRSVAQNIQFALRASGWKNKADIKKRISEVLMQVGMTGKSHAKPHLLSGGQQQRVAVARALINEPLLMIADEPTGNLDPEASYQLMKLLEQINKAGTTILMATHEYGLIKHFPGKVFELENARLNFYPSPKEFFSAFKSKIDS
ncbi:MAG: ATP-binding cassette domain-containing protein [Bacteroidia bacterium]|nr:ATP-binding cassette domain-containing protein [Bacteroidia bacterium]